MEANPEVAEFGIWAHKRYRGTANTDAKPEDADHGVQEHKGSC